jgi:hypothetical protein
MEWGENSGITKPLKLHLPMPIAYRAHCLSRAAKNGGLRDWERLEFPYPTCRFGRRDEMRAQGTILRSIGFVLLSAAVYASAADNQTVTVKGFVLDSACAFTKGLTKPVSKECARSCAKAGSPLVILADGGDIYWPIADKMPATGQNAKLLPFAGEWITATGKVYQRGGSKAIAIDKLELQAASTHHQEKPKQN